MYALFSKKGVLVYALFSKQGVSVQNVVKDIFSFLYYKKVSFCFTFFQRLRVSHRQQNIFSAFRDFL